MLERDGLIAGRPNDPELDGRATLGRRLGLVLTRSLPPPNRGERPWRRDAELRETLVVRVGLTRGRLIIPGVERGTVPVSVGLRPPRSTAGARVGGTRLAAPVRVGGTRVTEPVRVGGALFTMGARVGGMRVTEPVRVGGTRVTDPVRVGGILRTALVRVGEARSTVGARVGARPTVPTRVGARFTAGVRP